MQSATDPVKAGCLNLVNPPIQNGLGPLAQHEGYRLFSRAAAQFLNSSSNGF